jgi:AbrB family looped-hinge helix DNA binding protein
MNSTIDQAGRVVVPRAIREAVGLLDGGAVEIVEIDGRIVISPLPVAKRLEQRGEVMVCVPDQPVPTLDADTVRDLLEATRR